MPTALCPLPAAAAGGGTRGGSLRDAARHVSPYKRVIRACGLRETGEPTTTPEEDRGSYGDDIAWYGADLNDDRQRQSGGGSLAGEVYYRARVSPALLSALKPPGGDERAWCPEQLVRAVRLEVNGERVESFSGAALRLMSIRGQLVPSCSSLTTAAAAVDIVLPLGLCYPTAEPVPAGTRVAVSIGLDRRALTLVASHELETTWLRREPVSTAAMKMRTAAATRWMGEREDNGAASLSWVVRKVTRSATVTSPGEKGEEEEEGKNKRSVVVEVPVPSPDSVLCEVSALLRSRRRGGAGGDDVGSGVDLASMSVSSPSGEKRQKLDAVFSGEVLPRRHYGVSGRGSPGGDASWYMVPFEHLQDGITMRSDGNDDGSGDNRPASYFVCKLKVFLPTHGDDVEADVMACFIDALSPFRRRRDDDDNGADAHADETSSSTTMIATTTSFMFPPPPPPAPLSGGDHEISSAGGLLRPPPPPPPPPSSSSFSLLDITRRIFPVLLLGLAVLLLVSLFLELDDVLGGGGGGGGGGCWGCSGFLREAADTATDQLSSVSSSSSSSFGGSAALWESLLLPLGLGSSAAVASFPFFVADEGGEE